MNTGADTSPDIYLYRRRTEMWELIDRYFNAAKSKDGEALGGIFTDDAVYIEITGATHEGIGKIRSWFDSRMSKGSVTAWDIRKVIDAGENGAVVWYYEYRDNDGNSTSYDGVSVIELSDGRIKRWNEFSQPTEKTYS